MSVNFVNSNACIAAAFDNMLLQSWKFVGQLTVVFPIAIMIIIIWVVIIAIITKKSKIWIMFIESVGRVDSIFPIPFTTRMLIIQLKLCCGSLNQKLKIKPSTMLVCPPLGYLIYVCNYKKLSTIREKSTFCEGAHHPLEPQFIAVQAHFTPPHLIHDPLPPANVVVCFLKPFTSITTARGREYK